MIDHTDRQYLLSILNFLEKINIPYHFDKITVETYVPGILIKSGGLVIDNELLKFPGDILHEAGSIALCPADVRPTLNTPIAAQLDFDAATHSFMTLAWTYAAALDADTPLEVVFHKDGYHGQGESIANSFQSGQYIGLPMLQYLGMAYDAHNASQHNTNSFPAMVQWLRPKVD